MRKNVKKGSHEKGRLSGHGAKLRRGVGKHATNLGAPTSGPKPRREATERGRGAKLQRGVGKHATKHGGAAGQRWGVAKPRERVEAAASWRSLSVFARGGGGARKERGVWRRPALALARGRVSSRVSRRPSRALPRARVLSLPFVPLARSSAERSTQRHTGVSHMLHVRMQLPK